MKTPHPDPRAHQEGPACPVCRAPRCVFFTSGRDRLFGLAPGSFLLYRCRSCRCVFQHPLPPAETLSTFYPKEYWWSPGAGGQTRPVRMINALEKLYREFVAGDHVRFLEACARTSDTGEKRLLDIGCGSGTFLFLARRRGFIPHGMDVSPYAVEAAREQYRLPVELGEVGSDIWGTRRFDFITMFHVLEHLRDPAAALQYAGRLLAPAGSLIVQVPNAASLQARIFAARWYGFDVPRHLINFTPRSLEHLLDKAGWEIRMVSRFSLRDNPASLASSLVPGLDPIGCRGRGAPSHPLSRALSAGAYFGFVLAALPPALLESACGYGATLWVQAQRRDRGRLPQTCARAEGFQGRGCAQEFSH